MFKLLIALLLVGNSVFSSEEKPITFIKVIDTNSNRPVFPIPLNTPEEVTLDQITQNKKKSADVVLFDEDWELEWLIYLRDSVIENQHITMPLYIEKRTYLSLMAKKGQ